MRKLITVLSTVICISAVTNGEMFIKMKQAYIIATPVFNNTQRLSVKKKLKPQQVCISFLTWYVRNEKRLKKIDLTNGVPGDSTKSYSVNFNNTALYLNELKKSGYVSGHYIGSLNIFFNQISDSLKVHPQFDGPVMGMENDVVLQIMEENELTDHINNLKVLKASKRNRDDYYYVRLGSGKSLNYIFTLRAYNGKWLIESIYARFGLPEPSF